MRTLILLCFLPLCYCIFETGKMQTVGAKGNLLCNGKPAAKVKIKLYESEILLDRLLGDVYTNNTGYFTITGSAKE
ncbi:unnamed protein product, partial [Cylicostephanus goldi]